MGHPQFLALLDRVDGRDDVQMTFDDGNASDIELGLPPWRRRGSAQHSHRRGRLGGPRSWTSQTWRLRDAGMQIGSHGIHRRAWRNLDDRTLHEEWSRRGWSSRRRRRARDPAGCPFGAYDRRVLGAARKAGFRHVYTSDRGTAKTADFLQARNSIGPGDTPQVMELIAGLEASPRRLLTRRAKRRWSAGADRARRSPMRPPRARHRPRLSAMPRIPQAARSARLR